jgi:4-amino-4-deoxy-L-arabinose transferase-like glycosyltransferase
VTGRRVAFRPAVVAVCLLLAAAALSALVVQTSMPTDDEGAVLTAAAKILRGGVFYREIDAYWFPGAAYLLALCMALFGEHVSVARWLAAGAYCLLVVVLYLASLRLLDRRRAALFGVCLLGLKLVAWPGLSHYFYWDLAVCAAAGAIALLIARTERGGLATLAAAGLCVGLALLFKQNVGLYLAPTAAVFLLLPHRLLGTAPRPARERWREVAAFGMGVAAPLLPLLAYFAAQGVLGAMLYSALVRPFTGYLPTSSISYWPPLAWWTLGSEELSGSYLALLPRSFLWRSGVAVPGIHPAWRLLTDLFSRLLYTSVPLAFAWATVRWARARQRGPDERDARLTLLAALTAAVTLSAFPRWDFVHLIDVYPLVLLLLFALSQDLAAASPRLRFAVRAGEVVAVLAICLGFAGLGLERWSRMTGRLELDRATLRVLPDGEGVASVVRFLRDETDPGDPILVYGNQAYFYFLADRYSDWPFTQLYPGQTGGERGAEIVETLRANPPKLVVRGIVHRRAEIPPIAEYAPLLHLYLLLNYQADDRPFARYPPAARPPPQRLGVMRPRER